MTGTSSNQERQAVLIIHGIGEQEPMATLREFVESVVPDVQNDPMGVKEKFYVKPDQLSELFDLRRITIPTDKTNGRIKTDFYEYYWAHQMRGSTLSDVLSWIGSIFLGIKNVPPRLRPVHTILLLLVVLSGIALICIAFNYTVEVKKNWLAFMAAGAGTIYMLARIIRSFITSITIDFIGDAARYFTPKPGNVINRQNIRRDGLKLLRKLHGETDENGVTTTPYKKIIVVAHSLGSVIAYDLLSILWSNYHNQFSQLNRQHQDKLKEMQDKVIELSKKPSAEVLTEQELADFEKLQSELFEAGAAAGNPWRITDFVTLGSPLSHAQLLMAKGKDKLKQMQEERQYPTCPPELEAQNVISYVKTFDIDGHNEKLKVPHHAALFAVTRWTNVWFKNDFVGGPMQESFGKGINDIELTSKTHSTLPFLSHTFYWDKKETESVAVLRKVVF